MTTVPIRACVAALAVAGVMTVLAACAPEFKPDASTPKATVRTFLGHLARADAPAAYALLSKESQERCARSFFIDRAAQVASELENSRVVVRDVTVIDGRATVRASVDPGRVDTGLLGPRAASFETTYTLVQEAAEWRLNDTGWPYGYCDFAKPFAPEPARPTATPTPTPTVETPVPTPAR